MGGLLDLCSFSRHPPCNWEAVLGLPQMETSELLFHEHMLNNQTHCPWPFPSSFLISPSGKTSQDNPPTCLPVPAAGHPSASWQGI